MRFAVARADRAETTPAGVLGLLAEPETTPEGYLVLDAIVATPGILEYTTESGRKLRTLVRAETLQAAAPTLLGKPAAHGHPPEKQAPGWKINPDNAKQFVVGSTLSVSTLTAEDLAGVEGGEAYIGATRARMIVQDRKAIDDIRAGKIAVSAAYKAIEDDNDGKGWDDATHGHYDREQVTRIPYNHVAVGIPSGRAFGAVFRVDDADTVIADPEVNTPAAPADEAPPTGDRADGVIETIETTASTTIASTQSGAVETRETSETRVVEFVPEVLADEPPDLIETLAEVLGCEATREAVMAAVAALKAPVVVDRQDAADGNDGLGFDGGAKQAAQPRLQYGPPKGLLDSINAARAAVYGDVNRG